MRFTRLAWLGMAGLMLGACSQGDTSSDSKPASQTPAPVENNLTMQRLLGSPNLSGPGMNQVKMSPDGARVTFLRGKEDNKEQLDLWEYNIADGKTQMLVDSVELLGGAKEVLSEEEKARRERQRIKGSGIVSYSWNESGDALLFPLGGDVYLKPLAGEVKRLTNTEAFETDIKFSPKSNFVSFIRDRDLFVINVESGRETRLTTGATDTIAHGVAEFVAQEELSRYTGYWWSPDESKIAFTRIDESPVKMVNRYEMDSDGAVTTIAQRYPFAGSDNVLIELGVVGIDDKQVNWLDLGEEQDIYLARVNWSGSDNVLVQRMPRDQMQLDLIAYSANGDSQKTLLNETTEVWINLHKDLKPLKNTEQFVWASERSGFKHLYLYQNSGELVGALTSGDWVVDKLVQLDEANGDVYFLGFKDGTTEKHLYRASLTPNPASIERISQQPGWHSVAMGKDTRTYLDSFSSQDTPPQVALRNVADDSLVTFLNANTLDDSHPYHEYLEGHAASEFGQLKGADGTMLDYRIFFPPNMEKGKRYPAVLTPYGGPHGHRVANRWELSQNQMFAREGFVVLVVDGRGSYNRGVAFEAGVKNAMGTVEVEDQIAAAKYLQSLDYVDPERIGFHGWSYGGYMTIMMMAKAPELIKVGVSGAPVTDWGLYDTAYTERYLGHPKAPGEVYKKSSVFPYVDGISGKLLLIHGMADDNVFFDHSVKFMAEMQKKNIAFDLMTYPGQKHGIRGEATKNHVANLRLNYFKTHL